MSKEVDQQLKLAHKLNDLVDRANRKICVTLLRYNVNKPESKPNQLRFLTKKEEGEKFQQFVFVNFELEEYNYLLDVLDSLYGKYITIESIHKVSLKLISISYSLSFFYPSQDELEFCVNRNLYVKLKSKLGFYHVVITTPKPFPEELTLTVVERQQLPDLENTDSKEDISCSKRTI